MPDPAQAAVLALTGSATATVGQFCYNGPPTPAGGPPASTPSTASPGEIVPTTALMQAHQHPDDRAGTARLITAAVTDGFSSRASWTRSNESTPSSSNEHGEIITDTPRRDFPAAAQLAGELTTETRAAIEQAKGALMITYGIDQNEAFALLRRHSQHRNIKLRDIAASITDRTTDPGIASLTPAGKITAILADLSHPTTPVPATTAEAARRIRGTTQRPVGQPTLQTGLAWVTKPHRETGTADAG